MAKDSITLPIKRGFRFLHSHFVHADYCTPEEYVVTRVAQGVVYYRPTDGGCPMYCRVEDFHNKIKK